MGRLSSRALVACCVLGVLRSATAAGPVGSSEATHAMLERRERRKEMAAEYDAMTHCSIGCKNTFLGDRNCDEECYNEACEFDGGDCEDQWEVRRTVVLGAFFKEVDHVEYTAVGPAGASKGLSMEEGRHWEGNDVRTKEERANWRRMLQKDKEVFRSQTDLQRPAWYLDQHGDKVPAYKEENGVKWNVDKAGDWMLDAAGRRTAFTGGAGASDSGGFAYEYDDYYDYDHGDHEEL